MESDFIPFTFQADETDDREGEEGSGVVGAPALLTTFPAPWLQYLDPMSGGIPFLPPFVQFHNEILTFCEYTAPTRAELNKRDLLLQDIINIVQKVWPVATVHVFGSQLTKILTPTRA